VSPQFRSVGRAALAALILALGLLAWAPVGPTADALLQCGVLAGHHCATLSVVLDGNGTGIWQTTDSTHTIPNNLINCQRGGGTTSGTCAHGYDVVNGSYLLIYVQVTAATGSSIWIDGNYTVASPYDNSFSISSDLALKEYGFALNSPVTVSVSKSGTGSGSVTSSPRGIACGATCSDEFGSGLQLALIATPNTGATFGGWGSGPCHGQGSTCLFTPTTTVAIAATFTDITPPTTTPPLTGLRSGTTLGSYYLPGIVTWRAADSGGSGLASYDVARSLNGGAYTLIATGLTSPRLNVRLSFGYSFRFEVRAHDHAGNIGAWSPGVLNYPGLVQQTSTAIAYHGTWYTSTSTAYSGGSVRYSSVATSYASFAFSGRAVDFVTTRGPSRGSAKIYIDGSYVTTVSLYATTTTYRYVAYERTWGWSGTHTIRIVVVGTAGHPRVDVDAFGLLR